MEEKTTPKLEETNSAQFESPNGGNKKTDLGNSGMIKAG